MKLHKIFLTLFLIISTLALSTKSQAQELNANVQVIADNIQRTNKEVFTTLQTSIREFLNNRKWTQDNYSNIERIKCNYIINITEQSGTDLYSGTIQVQYARPIYRSAYESPVFVYQDKNFQFQYLEFDRLDFTDNTYLNNLTSVLAYYAYIVIGHDMDSYALKGGDEMFKKAQNIVNNAQSSGNTGWQATGNRNRYWLTDNLLSPAFNNYRSCIYQYHRLGLDLMYEPAQQKAAKEIVKNSLLGLNEVFKQRRNSMVMQLFFDSKSAEIISIFNGGEPSDLTALKELLVKLDASNAEAYQKMGNL